MSLFDVVWRAYILTEFDMVRSGALAQGLDELVDNALAGVMQYLERRQFDRWRSAVRMTIAEWRRIKEMALGLEIEQVHDFYIDLCWIEAAAPEVRHDFSDGAIRDLSSEDDLNELFAHLADLLKSEHAPEARVAFRAMAALGKSAVIEYHRRQISIGEDTSRLRSAVRVR